MSALILCRSTLGLLVGLFNVFWTELSAPNTSVFYLKDSNLSKSRWIFTNLMCAFILWRSAFGLLIGKIRRFLTDLSARDMINDGVLSFYVLFYLTWPICSLEMTRKIVMKIITITHGVQCR